MRSNSAPSLSGLPGDAFVYAPLSGDLIVPPSRAVAPFSGRWSALRSLVVSALASVVALAAVFASAQSTLTWNTGTGNWDTTSSNWTAGAGSTTWTNGSIATFGGSDASTITVNETGITAAGVNISAFSDTIAGTNSLTLTGGAAVSVSAPTAVISAPVAGSAGLFKSGLGSLSLSGTNTFTGGVTLSAGTLGLGSATAIPAGNTVTFAGGALQYSSSNTTDNSASFSTAAGQRYLISTGGSNSNATTVTFASPLTSSGGSLTKFGAGTLVLNADNTYSGTNYVMGGTLTLGNNKSLSGPVILSFNDRTTGVTNIAQTDPAGNNARLVVGTTGTVASTVGKVTLAAYGKIMTSATAATLTSTNSFELHTGIVGSSTSANFVTLAGNVPLSKLTPGRGTINTPNTYTGNTNILGGVLLVQNATAIPGGLGATGGTSHMVLNGGVFNLGTLTAFQRPLGTGPDAFEISGGVSGFGANTGSTTISIGNDTTSVVSWGSQYFRPSTFVLCDTSSSQNVTFMNPLDLNGATRTIAVNNPSPVTNRYGQVSGVISGTNAGLTKVGAGRLILTGANSYDGLTTVSNGGVINIQNATGLGSTAAGTVVEAGASLQVQGNITVGAEALTISGTGIVNNGYNVMTASPTNPVTPFVNTDRYSTTSPSNTGALRNISGANTYYGAVTLNGNSLIQSDSGVLTLPGGVTGTNRDLTVALGASAGNAGMSIPTITTGSGGLTVINATAGGAAAAGTLTLTGASTYSGTTTIRGGTLSLASGATLNGSAGTPLTFKGPGTFLATDVQSQSTPVNMGTLALTSGDGTVRSAFTPAGAVLEPTVVGFSSLSRSAGATVTFANQGGTRDTGMFSTGNVITVGSQSDGFIGPWAYYGSTPDTTTMPSGNGYAWYDATNGYVRDYRATDANYVAVGASSAGLSGISASSNAVLSGAVSGQNTDTVNTVNLGANNFAVNATNVLSTAGLLSSGAAAATFSGGSVQAKAVGGELVVRVNNAADKLTVSSVIQNNTSASSLTKSGAGTLDITTAPTYTGKTVVSNGILKFSAVTNSTLPSTEIVVNGGELQTPTGNGINYYLGGSGGTATAGNSLTIQNGGKWTQTPNFLYVGVNSNGNSVTIDGVGTVLGLGVGNNSTWFSIGGDVNAAAGGSVGSNNSLTVSNGALFASHFNSSGGTTAMGIGAGVGSNGNSMTVDGAGSLFNTTGQRFFVGRQGGTQASPNTLTVSNGGMVSGRVMHVGDNTINATGGSYNTVTVTGANSTVYMPEGTTVGYGVGTNNGIIVQNGGTYYTRARDGNTSENILVIGASTGANDNYVSVSGAGSKFIGDPGVTSTTSAYENLRFFIGGQEGALRNHVDVSDGGYLALNSLVNIGGTNSAINVGGATGAASFADFASVNMLTPSARVNVQNATVRFIQVMSSITGLGRVELKGAGTFSTDFTNSIDVPIFGTGSFTKDGTGLLSLTGANTYTGDTTVLGGTLSLSSPFLDNAANVALALGSFLNLGFSGTDTIGQLLINGVSQSSGTWGAIGSGAANETSYLTGTGLLNVTSAVPEPGTMALVAVAGLALAVAARRRR